jgi:hypothetical protein
MRGSAQLNDACALVLSYLQLERIWCLSFRTRPDDLNWKLLVAPGTSEKL